MTLQPQGTRQSLRNDNQNGDGDGTRSIDVAVVVVIKFRYGRKRGKKSKQNALFQRKQNLSSGGTQFLFDR